MTAQPNSGRLYVLVGPGGVGKNALLKVALERVENLSQLATATTRPPRDGEQHGKQRLFVTHAEFRRMLADGELVEHEEVHSGDFYGVPRSSIEMPISSGCDLIADIDMHGASTLRRLYPHNVVLIAIIPPGETMPAMLTVLRERLDARDASDEQSRKRLERAPEELLFAAHCDYLVVNDKFEQAVDMLRSIILAERSRRALLALRDKLSFSVATAFAELDALGTHG
jgi:guanylate kinase